MRTAAQIRSQTPHRRLLTALAQNRTVQLSLTGQTLGHFVAGILRSTTVAHYNARVPLAHCRRYSLPLLWLLVFGCVCCAAQTHVPPPGPLTPEYRLPGVSFRYPSDWIVDDTGTRNVTVFPPSALVIKADGHNFWTHGFFVGFVKDTLLSKSTDEVTALMLDPIDRGQQAQENRSPLTHLDKGSCGEILNPLTPYAGTETVMICALRVGNEYIWTEMFSPTTDWRQYSTFFSRVLETFSAVVVPPPGPLTSEYTFQGVASFRYPNNWIVGNSKEDRVVIAPASADFTTGGNKLKTHGLLIGFLGNFEHPISTDEVVTRFLEKGLDKSPPQLTHVDKGSCFEWVSSQQDTIGTTCALRFGNAYLRTSMWSPRGAWSEYKDVFSSVISTFSAVAVTPPGPPQTARELANLGFKSVVLLAMNDSNGQPLCIGSGFFISEDIVATNAHVIKDAGSGSAKLVGQEQIFQILGTLAVDRHSDLALLKVAGKAPSLRLSRGPTPTVGDSVFVIGNPLGLEGTFSTGIVSGVRIAGTDSVLQMTAPISPGSSGGPVMDASGEVVGVAVATFQEGQNLNLAVPVAYLERMLETHPTAIEPLKSSSQQAGTSASMIDGFGTRTEEGVIATEFAWTFGNYYEIRLINRLPVAVSGVSVVVVFYDRSGKMLDFDRLEYEGSIPAGLTTTVSRPGYYVGNVISKTWNHGHPTATAELRVIGFKTGKSQY